MRPNSQRLRRGRLLVAAQLVGILSLGACTVPAFRSQSPESELAKSVESQVKLVGDVAAPYGMTYVKVEAAALVTGLPDTGSDPPPSPQRAALLADMQARGVVNPNQVLAAPTTSLVWVRAYLPPAVQKGDRIDLEVRVPSQVDTTSLRGGWLMQTRLKEMALVGSQVREGEVLALGEGALLVDPLAAGEQDSAKLKQARVLGGGVALKSRSLGLVLKPESRNVLISKQIGEALNRRFHTYSRGSRQGVATPKTDEFIEVTLHPTYKHNLARYMRVVRSIALHETPSQQIERLKLLEWQLLDPVTSAGAALRLEAIGKEAIPVLYKGIAHHDPEVRFYAAEALAYLDDPKAAKPLAEAAQSEPAFRAYALTALGALDDIAASDELGALLDVSSAETRYGAFRALWSMNQRDPLVRGQRLGDKFSYHVLPSAGPPMIHLTRSVRPEVVLFGEDQQFQLPLVVEAGPSIVVRSLPDGTVRLSRFAVGKPDDRRVVGRKIDEVIRAAVDLGADYPDIVQLLQQARSSGALTSRLEVDAVPKSGRRYDRVRPDEHPDEVLAEPSHADEN